MADRPYLPVSRPRVVGAVPRPRSTADAGLQRDEREPLAEAVPGSSPTRKKGPSSPGKENNKTKSRVLSLTPQQREWMQRRFTMGFSSECAKRDEGAEAAVGGPRGRGRKREQPDSAPAAEVELRAAKRHRGDAWGRGDAAESDQMMTAVGEAEPVEPGLVATPVDVAALRRESQDGIVAGAEDQVMVDVTRPVAVSAMAARDGAAFGMYRNPAQMDSGASDTDNSDSEAEFGDELAAIAPADEARVCQSSQASLSAPHLGEQGAHFMDLFHRLSVGATRPARGTTCIHFSKSDLDLPSQFE